MRKRWWLLVAVVTTGLGLIGIVGLVLMPTRPEVTLESYGRIQQGMTLEEVKSILGEPDGYRFHPDGRKTSGRWLEDSRVVVYITFLDGNVIESEVLATGPDPTKWERLRRLLPW